ncbi:hypothetical protein ACFY5H_26545 [Streptomyces sp. NPDC013012]|uniref:hypothetical protein n=1 Tax=Streptomyces sp. NPDC013012 TaxID=3364860 RepID=UPI0036B01B85
MALGRLEAATTASTEIPSVAATRCCGIPEPYRRTTRARSAFSYGGSARLQCRWCAAAAASRRSCTGT